MCAFFLKIKNNTKKNQLFFVIKLAYIRLTQKNDLQVQSLPEANIFSQKF